MKVLIALDTLANAGTEKSTLDIISHFSADVDVVVCYFFPGDDLKLAYEQAGIRLRYEPIVGSFPILKGIRKLKKILAEEKPDVVVSSILRANLMARVACKQLGIPLVGTFVSDSYSDLRKSSFSLKRRIGFYYYYRLDRLTAGIPKGWISNSAYIRDSNCRYLNINPEKVTVIYRGRNEQKFPVKQNALLPGKFRFVFVARVLETKGVRELIEAFREVVKAHPETTLDVYGKGNFSGKAAAMIESYGLQQSVHLRGLVPNGWEKLYEADCFLFPSWYEGFSGSLVEAMMVGIPIIASDIPMNLEAVTPGKTARVHRVKNAGSLATEMKAAIVDYEGMKQMALTARQEAVARFSIGVIARQYQNYLAGVIRK